MLLKPARCPSIISIPRGCPKYTSPVNSLTIIISTPLTTSGFNVDDSSSSSNTIAGLKFAKRFNSFLMPKSAFSGLKSEGSVSYFQSPTAPR